MDLILACTSFLPAPGMSTWGTPESDVAHATLGLAKGLRALGHRATIVAPLDESLAHSGVALSRKLSPLKFDLSGKEQSRILFEAKLPSGVEVVLLSGDPPSESTSPEDHARRCALFGHAVAAYARQRMASVSGASSSEPELEAVVAVGEGAAFVPFAIREDAKVLAHDGGPSPKLLAGLARIAIPLDPAADRKLPRASLSTIGVADDLFSPEGIEFYGDASLTKAAAIAADRIVALGEAPRLALLQVGAPHRFDGVYRARGNDVVSIGSGIDHAQYNPATDPHTSARFDHDDLLGKERGKSSLLAELELDAGTDAPLAVVASSGLEPGSAAAISSALGKALRGELSAIVVLARPRTDHADDAALDKLARAHPGRVIVKWSATEALLHRALAAADLAVVFDPHGATATPVRAAMRYGAVPVAQRTPAIDEAVVDLEATLASGTGFLFADGPELFAALQRGVSAHRGRGFRALQRRVMRHEGGWERAARRLAHLIQQIEG